ncbi:MAG: hypothetical protein ABI045_01535 [Flavobacteriales bacterium]
MGLYKALKENYEKGPAIELKFIEYYRKIFQNMETKRSAQR